MTVRPCHPISQPIKLVMARKIHLRRCYVLNGIPYVGYSRPQRMKYYGILRKDPFAGPFRKIRILTLVILQDRKPLLTLIIFLSKHIIHLLTNFLYLESQSDPNRTKRSGHFEFKTLWSPTVVRLVSATGFSSQEAYKKYFTLTLRRRPYHFFTPPIERRKSRGFLPPRILLV